MSALDPHLRPPLVLIANDQEWSGRSLDSILAPRGYAILRAYNGRQALDMARSTEPDALILDLRMPDPDGLEVCRTLRDDPRFNLTTPIIITTSGPIDREQRNAVYAAGAWELHSQPFDGELLVSKLDTFMRAKREADTVRDEGLLDVSTGLYNMRGLATRAREIGAQTARKREALACVAFAPRLPGDTADAAVADEAHYVLAEHVGTVCRSSGRASDAFGRLGQSEFAVIAPATQSSGAVRLVERLRDCIQSRPVVLKGSEREVSISAGYCAVTDFAESSVDAVEMLFRASKALNHSRAQGGLRVIGFEDLATTTSTS